MENFRQSVYNTCLNKMVGFSYEQCRELIDSGLYGKYQRGLAIDDYIEGLRLVLNKRLFASAPITPAELDNCNYDTYYQHSRAIFDFVLDCKDEYTQTLVDILVDFQDNFVANRTYTGTILDNKVCFVNEKFANLSKASRDFLVIFLRGFLHPMHIYEGYGSADRLEKAIAKYVIANNIVTINIDQLKQKYHSITSDQLAELGLKATKSEFHSGLDVTADANREIVVIPAFIDGKNIGKLDTTYVSQGAAHPQTVVILGDVDMIDNFMCYSQNVTKIYALGKIKGMCRYSLNASGNLFTTTDDATYLNVNDNPYYVLKSVKKSAPSHFRCHEQTQVIGSHAFDGSNVTSIDFANAQQLSDQALAFCKVYELDFSNFDRLSMKVCFGCDNLKRVVLGSKMSYLQPWPFDCVSTLEEIVISSSFKASAFSDFESNCGIKKIVVLTDATLPICLFRKCKDLQQVVCTENTYKKHLRPGLFGMPDHQYDYVDVSTYKTNTASPLATKTQAKSTNATLSTPTNTVATANTTAVKIPPATATQKRDTSRFDTAEARQKDQEFIKLLKEKYDADCYDEEGGVASLSGPTGIAYKKFHAPKWFGELPITSIWYFFHDEEEEIEYVHFKNDTQLQEEVLMDCPNLEYIQADGDITYVHGLALSYVPKLETKHGGVTYVKVNDNPYYIAKECTSKKVKDVVLHPDCVVVQNSAFNNNETIESVNFANVKYIGDNIFSECPNLKKITVNDTTISIGLNDDADFVFNCNALEHLDLGNGVQKINCFPVRCCDNLKQLTLPPLVSKLANGFCQKCDNLTEVKFPPNLDRIAFATLAEMTALKTIYVGKDTIVETTSNDVWDDLLLSSVGGTAECTKRISKIKIIRY